MFPRITQTKDKRNLIIREAEGKDAGLVLKHIERVSGETDFLSFGPGERIITQPSIYTSGKDLQSKA